MAASIGRRAVIGAGAVTALVVPFAVSLSSKQQAVNSAVALAAGAAPEPAPGAMLGAYVKIDGDNIVTVCVGSTEMGQGIMTGLAQLVAEELNLDWGQVRTEHALAYNGFPNPYGNPIFHAQLTGGSTSMRGWYMPLRQAAAIAGQMLKDAAESMTPGGGWTLAPGGNVTNGTKTYAFSELVAKAATLTPPTSAPIATTRKFIGQRMARTDIPAKVNGSAIFGIDVRLPGMLYASVCHSPVQGGTVASMPSSVPGALAVVNLGNAVGVVANDTWSAMNIANGMASKVTWKAPANLDAVDSTAILAMAQSLATSTSVTPRVYETTGTVDPAAAIQGAAKKIDATYNLPYLAHTCMEVLCCTVSLTPTSCEIWAPTQGQQFCIPTAAAITGLPASAIKVNTTFLGGGNGRKFEMDYVSQAVTIAKAVGKPVKLTWSRKQDFQNDRYRPCATIRVQAGLDGAGNIAGLLYRNVSPSINIQRNTNPGNNPEDTGAVAGALGLPYAIANRRIEFVPNPADILLGYWRSVGESYNTFAVECAIDEMALAAGQDPMAFRKARLAGNLRAMGVLNAVDKLSRWSTSTPPAGVGRGVAFLSGFGSYIAQVAHVTMSGGTLKVLNMFCAIDCGVAINPDSIEAQMQGGIIHGLSATLWGQATFAKGVPNLVNFSNQRVMLLREAPTIAVKVVKSTAAPGGVGETGVPCVAPAVANAHAALTGARVRTLPFYPGSHMSDD